MMMNIKETTVTLTVKKLTNKIKAHHELFMELDYKTEYITERSLYTNIFIGQCGTCEKHGH